MYELEKIDILIVGSSWKEAEWMARALQPERPDVHIVYVGRGAEALDHVLTSVAHRIRKLFQPRLILLDLDMVGADAMQVLRAIKEDPIARRIPVVVMASARNEDEIRAVYDLKANSYVLKPADLHAFTEFATRTCTYWLRANQSA